MAGVFVCVCVCVGGGGGGGRTPWTFNYFGNDRVTLNTEFVYDSLNQIENIFCFYLKYNSLWLRRISCNSVCNTFYPSFSERCLEPKCFVLLGISFSLFSRTYQNYKIVELVLSAFMMTSLFISSIWHYLFLQVGTLTRKNISHHVKVQNSFSRRELQIETRISNSRWWELGFREGHSLWLI